MQTRQLATLPSGTREWPTQTPAEPFRNRLEGGAQAEADISFREVSAMLWRRRLVNLMIVSAFLGAAVAITLLMHKKYQATSEMIVLQAASPQQSLATPNNAPPTLLNGVVTPLIETPDTQVAMIASAGMAQRTLDYLKNQGLKQNKTLADLGIDIGLEELMAAILVVNPKGTNLLEVSVTAKTPEMSQTLTNAVCEAFVQWKREVAQQSVDEMSQNLDVRAERAHAAMLQAEKRETTFQKRWHVVDVPEQEKEALAQAYARQSDVAALEQEAAAQRTRLSTISAQLAQANREIGSIGGVRDDLLISSLQQQLSQAQMDLAAAQRKYTAAYPGVVPDLQARVTDLQSRLAHAFGSAVHGNASLQSQSALKDAYQQGQVALAFVQNKLAAATLQSNTLAAESAKWPELHSQYQRLANEADLARILYATLESQVTAAHSGKDMTTGNVQITQVALLPDMANSPKIPMNIALGLVLGLITAAVSTLMKSQSDRCVHSVEDALKLTTGPCVGNIPTLTAAEIRDLKNSESAGYVQDAFGLVGANLMLIAQGHEHDSLDHLQIGDSEVMPPIRTPFPQVILVTSALPGEGKSTVAAELAKAIARSSRSVVLVDADLRRPTQHHLFDTKKKKGLSNVLAETTSLESVIGKTTTPNLRMIRSGSAESERAIDPVSLLSQPMMRDILTTLTSKADVVIIDTPPSAMVPDALFLAPYAGCVLQVIGIEYADSDAVRNSTDAFYGAAPGAVAFLVNRAPRTGKRRNSYHTALNKRPSNTPRIDTPTREADSNSRGPSKAPRIDTPTRQAGVISSELVHVGQSEKENPTV